MSQRPQESAAAFRPTAACVRPAAVLAALAAGVLFASCSLDGRVTDPRHAADVEAWAAKRDADLRGEESWLTLVALHFLEPGETTFGSAPDNALVLPPPVPPRAGVLRLEEDRVVLESREDAGLSIAGRPVAQATLRSPDDEGGPDVVQIGGVRFYTIRRGGRVAIRAKDSNSPVRASFDGIERYPVDARYRVRGTLRRHEEPREIAIPTVLGSEEPMISPGVVEFELMGRPLALEPVTSGSRLFLIFRDATAEDETYGAGRFLYADAPRGDGTVELDFNRAYNPPCAFTPYATCPLPPPQNRLDVRIKAGEKRFAGGVAH